jgi:hypothetical protein
MFHKLQPWARFYTLEYRVLLNLFIYPHICTHRTLLLFSRNKSPFLIFVSLDIILIAQQEPSCIDFYAPKIQVRVLTLQYPTISPSEPRLRAWYYKVYGLRSIYIGWDRPWHDTRYITTTSDTIASDRMLMWLSLERNKLVRNVQAKYEGDRVLYIIWYTF